MDEELYDEFGNYVGPELDDAGSAAADDDDDDGDDGGDGAEGDGDAAMQRLSDAPGVLGRRMRVDDDGDGDAAEAAGLRGLPPSRAIILHEDRKVYPDADEVYPDAETLVQDEDTQALSEPIIAPVRTRNFEVTEREAPKSHFSKQFLAGLLDHPQLIRNVLVAGHIHHGKTSFVDMLVRDTHTLAHDPHKELKYTDVRLDEQERGVSIKATPITLAMANSAGKSYCLNLFDAPGHVNFSDEVTAAMRMCDGLVLVVDVLEGVMAQTDRVLRHAIAEQLRVTVVINKIDRLILELKLPPADAYFKIRSVLDEINAVLAESPVADPSSLFVSPERGNVCFASSLFGFMFTLESFAEVYAEQFGLDNEVQTARAMQRVSVSRLNQRSTSSPTGAPSALPVKRETNGGDGDDDDDDDADGAETAAPIAASFSQRFAKRLWGDVYFDERTRMFVRTSGRRSVRPPPGAERSFVQFILTPLYKLFAHVVGEEPKDLAATLRPLGVSLKKSELALDAPKLLRLVVRQLFGSCTGFVDMVVQHLPSPVDAAPVKVQHTYTGPLNTLPAAHMITCSSKGPLMVNICKLIARADGSQFDAFGRVMGGTLHPGQDVFVLGERFTLEDDEDMARQKVQHLYISCGRYKFEVSRAPAGSWVLIEGIDQTIMKTATVVDADNREPYIFRPLPFNTLSVMKIAVEPLRPSQLPKMLDGFRKLTKSFPLLETRVEESGEHVIIGTGELYLDVALHDLRHVFGDMEIKVSDPVVVFRETVVETSSMKCFAQSPNKLNKLTMIAEPLEKGLAEDIENGLVRSDMDRRALSEFFRSKYGYDVMQAGNVWAFGGSAGPNLLMNDTLPTEVNMPALRSIQPFVVQGFEWGVREGPLCDEPIRNVKFKLLEAELADELADRGRGQLIPTSRRVAYSAFMLATPRLMEPVYYAEIETPADCIAAVYSVLNRRRGHVTLDLAKPGSPLYSVQAYVPVIDSFGFETDLRAQTQGQAFVQCTFDHWSIVPGDPLDRSIVLRPLEPAPMQALAREFMVKTRRRKGLADDVSLTKFLDDPMLAALAQEEGGEMLLL